MRASSLISAGRSGVKYACHGREVEEVVEVVVEVEACEGRLRVSEPNVGSRCNHRASTGGAIGGAIGGGAEAMVLARCCRCQRC